MPGQDQEPDINLFNAWMRQQPWYQQWFQQQGLNPNQVKLSGDQRKALQGVIAQHGYDIGKGGMTVDPAGNLNDIHGFAGQPGWLKAIEIAGAAVAGGYGAAALMGGGGGAVAGGGAAIGAAPTSIIPATIGGGATAITGATGIAGATGALGTIGSLLAKGAPVLSAVGRAVGGATQAAGQNQLTNEQLAAQAYGANTSAQSAFQNQQQNMSQLETGQRSSALKDIYRASYAQNPRVSPFDPVGAPKYSSAYMGVLSGLEQQAAERLKTAPKYGTDVMPAPTYTPYVPNTKPSTMQTVGNWIAPALTIAGALGQNQNTMQTQTPQSAMKALAEWYASQNA
jgi:hypothetical protein